MICPISNKEFQASIKKKWLCFENETILRIYTCTSFEPNIVRLQIIRIYVYMYVYIHKYFFFMWSFVVANEKLLRCQINKENNWLRRQQPQYRLHKVTSWSLYVYLKEFQCERCDTQASFSPAFRGFNSKKWFESWNELVFTYENTYYLFVSITRM